MTNFRLKAYRILRLLPFLVNSNCKNKISFIMQYVFGNQKPIMKFGGFKIIYDINLDRNMDILFNFLKILRFCQHYSVESNQMNITFDNISLFHINIDDIFTKDANLINFLADAISCGSAVAQKDTVSNYCITERDFVLEDHTIWVNGVRFSLETYNYTIIETFTMRIHDIETSNYEGKNVLDIGAAIGETALYFAKQGAYVIAAEMDETRYNEMLLNLSLNPQLAEKIKPVHAAIGADGEVEYYYEPHRHIDSSMFKSRFEGVDYNIGKRTAKSYTINSLIEEFGLDRIDYLKMDCKGCEFFLKQEDLEKVKSLKIEYMIIEKSQNIKELMDLIRKTGFKVRLFKHNVATRKSFNIGGNIFATKVSLKTPEY